ncbi:MAG: hybrid sensor histidine kinase/response regulator [Desulfobacterales bacterium]|nr:hybrid sensor histidine kinase/response regulator [Desulfobacterales bacterium]
MKILIIDDNPDIRNLIQVILKPYDLEVLLADSGPAGFEILRRQNVELIILDIILPGMDGYEICRTLKENPETREIPVIFLSVKDETESLVRGLKIGAVDYISKPFHHDEFIARIKVHLELYKNKDLLRRQLEENKQLIHILSHDLKNPIGSAQSFLELLEDDPDDLEECLEYAKMGLDQGLQIITLVRDFMALKDKKAKLTLMKLNLKRLVDISQSILMNMIREKQLTVAVDISSDIFIRVDEASFINSVLNNLLTNAIKFSFPGSQIGIRAETVQDGDRETTVLYITDHGIGIPEDMVGNLFDIKESLSRPGTEGEMGTGFGMPLVKTFVEAYGGTIEVRSKEKTEGEDDHGTTVIISL